MNESWQGKSAAWTADGANPRLNFLDLRAERLLGQIQAGGGAAEMKLIGNHNIVAQLAGVDVDAGEYRRTTCAFN